MSKSKRTKIIKYSIASVIILIMAIAGFMVYKTLFSSSDSSRFDGIESHKLSNDEINSAKGKINELDNIESVDIYTSVDSRTESKIIKIFIKLKSDIDFDKVKEVSNQLISSFKEDNLSFYDLEIFVDNLNEESEVYPQIGYKNKKSSEFVW